MNDHTISSPLEEGSQEPSSDTPFDKFHEECAVVGVIGNNEAANLCYLGLYAMQHRGQEGAGIVASDGRKLHAHKDRGLVADVFQPQFLHQLSGSAAIGHTRYATFGAKDLANLQPFVANFLDQPFSVAHNGNLINATELREELEEQGAIFSSTSDTEVILHLIARQPHSLSFRERIVNALKRVKGAYSLVILTNQSLFAVRDPYGVRPLSVGQIGESFIVASETCAFDLVGAQFVRDVEPGEVLEVAPQGGALADTGQSTPPPLHLSSDHSLKQGVPALCVFEFVYFARPDSNVEGKSVYAVRKGLGVELAKEHPAHAELVIPVPDSGVAAALGYAQQSGLPLELGLIRNHYVGRTFIEPKQSIRDFGVKVKLNPTGDVLRGKSIVVVDDSIVRGTTCRKIIKMLRGAGAREVHFRVSSPPTIGSCYYGIDTPTNGELIAATHTVEQIREFIGADSLGFLSVEGMYRAVNEGSERFCDACFTRNYRLGKPKNEENCGC